MTATRNEHNDATGYNAELYDRYWRRAHLLSPQHSPWWRTVQELCAEHPRRLEIGPGVWPRLPVRDTHVVDLSPYALDVLAAEGALPHLGTLQEVDFPSSSFDFVALFEVLEHVDDDRELLSEIARVLSPGGRLMASTPLGMAHFNAWDEFCGHVRRFEPAELLEKLTTAGFRLDTFEVSMERSCCFPAGVAAWFTRSFPGLSIAIMERWLMKSIGRKPLEWQAGSEWMSGSAGAHQCTVLCTRV